MAGNDDLQCELMPSRKGGSALLVNGHVQHINYKKEERHYWKCRESNCKVTAITVYQYAGSVCSILKLRG